MAKFYVGQRIRKVRGSMALGAAGMFAGEPRFGFGAHFDGHVILDTEEVGTSGEAKNYGDIISSQWEPLVPPHEACESEFKESLEELLARQAVEA